VVDDAPGLFFCGLSFQYAFASMVFAGVGRDAKYLADRIDARSRTLRRLPAAA
jgi:putative flavoprotein involved in K+ transport